jgi:predicted small secreted protein
MRLALGVVLSTLACVTVEGAGEDIETPGSAIQEESREAR